MDKSNGQGGAIPLFVILEPSRASAREKAAAFSFSDYEYEMAMLETELELEHELASRADDTD